MNPYTPITWPAVKELQARIMEFRPVSRMELGNLIATIRAYREKFGPLEPEPVKIDGPRLLETE